MRFMKSVAVIAVMGLSLATPLQARVDGGDRAAEALNFGDLEFAVPRDPLLWSNAPLWTEQHTPRSWLIPALNRLRAAVPMGTGSASAATIMHNAGARCRTTSPLEIDCRYRDTESPRPGYADSVEWDVTLRLAGGKVSDLDVSRAWYRHS